MPCGHPACLLKLDLPAQVTPWPVLGSLCADMGGPTRGEAWAVQGSRVQALWPGTLGVSVPRRGDDALGGHVAQAWDPHFSRPPGSGLQAAFLYCSYGRCHHWRKPSEGHVGLFCVFFLYLRENLQVSKKKMFKT